MLIRLFALFVIVPLVELVLLLRLAEATSALTTIMIVVVTGIIGSFLAKREGFLAWTRFQSALGEGRMPSVEIQDGLMVVFAAALLLTPGLLTDALGFTLLTPIGRHFIRKFVIKRFVGNVNVHVQSHGPMDDPLGQTSTRRQQTTKTIDVEAVRK
ncbi:MAG: FxsA family protein [Rubripirellula sp.]